MELKPQIKRKDRENEEREMKVHELFDGNKREKQNNKKNVGKI
jgi:hypothetical protein